MAGAEASELEQLKAEREATLDEIAHLQAGLEYEVDTSEDEADPDIFEREKTMALIQALERKLESIEYAIQSASRGTYGICEICGERIDPARLEAVPHTTLCIKCKTNLEKRNRRIPSSSSTL
jgi:RNA polymerase-binding protein DksA